MGKWIAGVWIGLLLLCSTQGVVASNDLARATLVRGLVTAVDADLSRRLQRNDVVRPGEVIKTGPKGLVQLVFPDQSMIYVKASSELRIDAFHFTPESPADDQAVTSLLKGGMRALSGMVGKRSPEDVRYNTRVSTIGIRGTALDINQGGPECLANEGGGDCGTAEGDWSVSFDFGRGWVATEGGRVELEEGQTVRFNRRQSPMLARLERRRDDPAFLARQFAQMEPAQIESLAKEQAFRLRKEDLYLAIGMLNQSDRFTLDTLEGAIQGFSRAMSREERSELREFTTRIYPREGARIMRSTTLNPNELTASLESVLRGMENASAAELQQLYRSAVEMGITKEQAEEVMKNLQDDPLQCQ